MAAPVMSTSKAEGIWLGLGSGLGSGSGSGSGLGFGSRAEGTSNSATIRGDARWRRTRQFSARREVKRASVPKVPIVITKVSHACWTCWLPGDTGHRA